MTRFDPSTVFEIVTFDTAEEATAARRRTEAMVGVPLPPLKEELRLYALQGRTPPQ